jgi:hypothetical protein
LRLRDRIRPDDEDPAFFRFDTSCAPVALAESRADRPLSWRAPARRLGSSSINVPLSSIPRFVRSLRGRLIVGAETSESWPIVQPVIGRFVYSRGRAQRRRCLAQRQGPRPSCV